VSAAPLPGAPEGAAELRLPVVMPDGVRCAGCVERLRTAIEALDGVHAVVVDTRTWTLAVSYNPAEVVPEELESASRRYGLEIGESLSHASYRLTGLD
jgi:copper chaperone CopZ